MSIRRYVLIRDYHSDVAGIRPTGRTGCKVLFLQMYVQDKAGVGMNTDLHNALAMKTPQPEDYVAYLNLLQNTGHQLEDVASFNHTVIRAKDSSHRDKRNNRHTSTKKQSQERRGLGPRNPKLSNPGPRSFTPPESEHAIGYKDRAQTVINPRKRWN